MAASNDMSSCTGRIIFLKLKGGGSLLVAFPSLLGIRKAAPKARLTLVCTPETKVYAELLNLFDDYCLIDDRSLLSLIQSAIKSLIICQRAALCVDLEVNSVLASVFAVLTMAARRIGFVKPEEKYRAEAYTDALAFNVYAPIYIYYDQVAQLLDATVESISECRAHMNVMSDLKASQHVLGLSAFTSDFAQERMMPNEVWAQLLQHDCTSDIKEIRIFGSLKNKPRADMLAAQLRQNLPHMEITNQSGLHTLNETLRDISHCAVFWSIDSGLLHIARLLGVPCRSFWGPTHPAQRLRPLDGYSEQTNYLNFVCSPCVHISDGPPCRGNNLCMKSMTTIDPDTMPLWRI